MGDAALWWPWLFTAAAVGSFIAAIVWIGKRLPPSQDSPLADLAEEVKTLRTTVEDLSRRVGSLSAQVDALKGVVYAIEEERRVAAAVEREYARQQTRRAGDVTVNTAAPGMHFAGATTIEGPAIGGNVGTMGPAPLPPPKLEGPHTV